jgi:hypothetical protein
MRKGVQDASESAIAEFEKRQPAKQERLRRAFAALLNCAHGMIG